jgi:UDP-3-O-[3-hydroxymyristoyl] glucosamine N-acyltransferase LpxD
MKVNAKDIAKYLKSDLIGEDVLVTQISPLNESVNGSISFVNKSNFNGQLNTQSLYIIPEDVLINNYSIASYIRVRNPRLSFAKVISKFMDLSPKKGIISSSAVIPKSAIIGVNSSIGEYCVIGEGVLIGENTIINNNVIIFKDTVIGNNCYIKSGSVIGEDGFGFDFEEDGTPVRIPHIGKVIIEDNVEIGAKCTIARGTLSSTIIKNNVKLDDQIHIGHNCFIGEKTIITACAEISGSAHIGKKCWIGPNVSIMEKIKIGDGALIGLGAVITKNIPPMKKIMGFESLELKDLIKIKKNMGFK